MRSFESNRKWLRALLVLALQTMAATAGTLTDAQQQRVTSLEVKLLAPCCYQEPVGRHQSEAALRMRLEIARLVEAGRSESEIVDNYVKRYGRQIVADYTPTPAWAQYVPWVLSMVGAGFLAWWIRARVARHNASQG